MKISCPPAGTRRRTAAPVHRALRHPLATALLVVLSAADSAYADSPIRPLTPAPTAFQQECATCHMAFPPGLLPAASWQRLMGQLGKHFGTDASVDAATRDTLTRWLVANGGTSKRGREEPPQDRITRASWFGRKHHEVSPATWSRPAIKSPANCAACHPKAEEGDFDEHAIRIPR